MIHYALAVLDDSERPIPAILVDGRVHSLASALPGLIKDPEAGLLDIFENWEHAHAQLSDLAARLNGTGGGLCAVSKLPDDGYRQLVSKPVKMIFAGLNYYDHLRVDLGITDFDKRAVDPLFFLKHAGAHVAAGQPIAFPKQTNKFDWELELVAIFGHRGRAVASADAMQLVAGYTIGLDLSARDWQMSDRHMRKFDLFGGKAFDDSSPVGPWFVPAEFVDAGDLPLDLWVNGERKQHSSTREMIWSTAELIESITQHMAVEPGDMLFTGSPAGVGLFSGTFLKPGDVITAEIPGLGRIRTPVLA
jgi:2,4-diketo-3-deoxy-L-fuconate hydrolase